MGPEADNLGTERNKDRASLDDHRTAEPDKDCSLEQEAMVGHCRQSRFESAAPSSDPCDRLDRCNLDRRDFRDCSCSGWGAGHGLPTAARAVRAGVEGQGMRRRSAVARGGTLAVRCTAAAAAGGGTAGEHSSGGSLRQGAECGQASAGHVAGHARDARAAGAAATPGRPSGEDEPPNRGRGSADRTERAAGCTRRLERAGDNHHGRVLLDHVRHDRLDGAPAGTVGYCTEHNRPGHSSERQAEGPAEAAHNCMPWA
jgi:hypothetical protein